MAMFKFDYRLPPSGPSWNATDAWPFYRKSPLVKVMVNGKWNLSFCDNDLYTGVRLVVATLEPYCLAGDLADYKFAFPVKGYLQFY